MAVRGGRRFDGDATHPGDAPPLVVVRSNSRTRMARVAAATWRLIVISYETDPRLAMLLDGRVSDALHAFGPRHTSGGVAIYRSAEEVGGQAGEDPDTGWSNVTSIYTVHGSTVIW